MLLKSYGAEVHAALGVLDLDPISKIEACIFLWKIQHIRRCSLVAQIMSANMSYWHWRLGLRIKKCGISWPTLVLEYILFCFGETHYKSFLKRYLFAFLDNIYFVENKYVMCELLYNIEIYITWFLATIIFSFPIN